MSTSKACLMIHSGWHAAGIIPQGVGDRSKGLVI